MHGVHGGTRCYLRVTEEDSRIDLVTGIGRKRESAGAVGNLLQLADAARRRHVRSPRRRHSILDVWSGNKSLGCYVGVDVVRLNTGLRHQRDGRYQQRRRRARLRRPAVKI